MPNSITVNKDPYGVYTETKDPYGICATTKDPYGVYEKLELRPAHEPFQPKQEPFLSGVSKDIYRGLAESPYLEPLEGYGFAGDVSNIIRQPIRAVGQIASIPFAGMPPPDIGFSDIEDLIKEEGIPNAITKYGLDIVMMAAAKIGIPIEPLLRRYGIPPVFSGILRSVARGSLGRRMKGVAPAEAPAKAEVPLKPVSPVKPKPEITPEMFEKTQAIPLSEVERASQMRDIMREKMRKEIVEGAPELPKAEPLAVPKTVQRTEEPNMPSGSVNKPHGLYTTPSEVISPHLELGGKKTFFNTNPNAKILNVSEPDIVRTNRGMVGASAGIRALYKLIGKERIEPLLSLSKKSLM